MKLILPITTKEIPWIAFSGQIVSLNVHQPLTEEGRDVQVVVVVVEDDPGLDEVDLANYDQRNPMDPIFWPNRKFECPPT